jgi:signal transduction histidine kinase
MSGIKPRFSSSLDNLDEVMIIHEYPRGALMQHQENPAHQLAQKINQIMASNSATTLMLQEIAGLLGMAFDVDCCYLVSVSQMPQAVTSEQIADDAITGTWCKSEYADLPNPDEMYPMGQFHLDAAEPLTIEDISIIENSLMTGCQYLPFPIKTVLAIPTQFGSTGENNGVVCLIRSQAYDWSESEKQLLKALEVSCALAFAQVKQAESLRSQQQFVQTCANHQSLIKQLSILSRSNLELTQMLQLVITSTSEALEVDRGLLILLKYTDPLFRIRQKRQVPKAKATIVSQWSNGTDAIQTQSRDDAEESFFLYDCTLCQRVFTEPGKPIVVNDITEITDASTVAPVFALEQLPAVLLMPLESQGRILGFLVLQQALPRRWQPAESNIVEMVCAQLSNAVIQSQTLRQVQTLVDERTAQLQRSLEVQAKLYEKTRQYVEQLRELNELKDEFLSNMSDRLRYPLTNMRMAMRNLRQPGIQPERQARYLDILEQECTKEINLINDLLTLQKLDTHQERPQIVKIDLNSRIQDIAQTFEAKLAEKNISIVVELPSEQLSLETEIESFDRILQELLTNASKYSQPDTTVYLQATHEVQEQVDRIIIKVTNIGRGISEEEATYIFDKFRRGRGRWTPGTGLGLALVKSLVQHLNGEITVASIPIEGSNLSKICFTVNLLQFSEENKP